MSAEEPWPHTEDCTAVGDQECAPAADGDWTQPTRPYVEAARRPLGVDEPWCRIREEAVADEKMDDPLYGYEAAMGCAKANIPKGDGENYRYERVGTGHGIAWRLTWWTPNLTEVETQRHLAHDAEESLSWDEGLENLVKEDGR